jgi:uncharacterized protein (TIGR03067 family)
MNKLTLMTIMLWVAAMIGGCSASLDNNIEGTWSGQDAEGHRITLQFSGDDLALTQDERTLIGTWSLDTSEEPAQLTLRMHTPAGNIQQVPMIAKMVSFNKLMLRTGTDLKSRPTTFVSEGAANQLLLKRIN